MNSTKTINYLMVLFAFVFPISIGAANIILALMLLLWFIEGDFKRKFIQVKEEKILWIFFLIAVLTLFSAILSHSMTDSFLARPNKSLIKVIFSHYVWIPILLLIFVTSIEKSYVYHITSAFLSSIFLSEVTSYLIIFKLIDYEYFKSIHILYRGVSLANPTPFIHHTAYSVFLIIAILLLLDRLIRIKHRSLQLFILLFLTSATVNLFMNGGRTGQMAFILSIFTYMLFSFKAGIKSILLTVIVLTGIVFTAYKTSSVFHYRVNLALHDIQKVFKGNYYTSWGVRVASNKVALDYLLSSPQHFIFGAGAGDAKKEYLQHAQIHFGKEVSKPIQYLQHLHNQYLQYWFDGTFFALLLFLSYFYLFFKIAVQPMFKPLLYAVGVVILFSMVGDILFFRYKPAILFLLMTGLFIISARKEKHDLST